MQPSGVAGVGLSPLARTRPVSRRGGRCSYDGPVRSADTSPDAHARQVAVHRAMTPAERVATAVAMSQDAAAVAATGIAARHPDYDSDQVRRAYLRLCWGDELYAAVFPGAALLDP
jgi:hypothetical protein